MFTDEKLRKTRRCTSRPVTMFTADRPNLWKNVYENQYQMTNDARLESNTPPPGSKTAFLAQQSNENDVDRMAMFQEQLQAAIGEAGQERAARRFRYQSMLASTLLCAIWRGRSARLRVKRMKSAARLIGCRFRWVCGGFERNPLCWRWRHFNQGTARDDALRSAKTLQIKLLKERKLRMRAKLKFLGHGADGKQIRDKIHLNSINFNSINFKVSGSQTLVRTTLDGASRKL